MPSSSQRYDLVDQETEWLYQALSTELGIELSADDVDLLLGRLYNARRKAGDSALDRLQFRRVAGHSDKLWIVKGPSDGPT